jgi:hypothetical protein
MLNLFKSNKKKHNLPKRFWTVHELSEKDHRIQMDNQLYKNLKGSEFKKYITKYLSPKLRELGFKGSGFNFRKFAGNYIHTIQFFGDKYGGRCWVEVGIHLDFLPDSLHKPIEIKKIKTIGCFTRHSLHLENGNQMVDYGVDELEAKESIDLIFNIIIKSGIPYFNLFNSFPAPFNNISLVDLKKGNPKFDKFKINLGSMLTTLQLARIKYFMEFREEAKKIAEYGKTQVDGIRGSGLLIYLDKIVRGDDNFNLNEKEQESVDLEREKFHNELFGK